MEAFTSGKVSTAAGKAYLADHPWLGTDQLVKIPSGFVMHAWESQIRMARAYGRGVAAGDGRQVHPFDS